MPAMPFADLFERHTTRPIDKAIAHLRQKARAINRVISGPAAFDQFPGRRVPYNYTRRYRVDTLITPRRNGTTGYQGLAPVASATAFVLPTEGNIRVGRFGTFTLVELAATSYISITYNADPGLPGDQKVFTSFGDIMDDVVQANGGAIWSGGQGFWTRNSSQGDDTALTPTISFDVGLYDSLRGAYMHDGNKMPVNVFSGQMFANRATPEPVAFDANTVIEPRLFLNEINLGANVNEPGGSISTDQAYNATVPRVYVFLTFKGYLEQNELAPPNNPPGR